MYRQKQLHSVQPEVAAVMREIIKEEAVSNLHQAMLGKRVRFNEKEIACTTSLETIEVTEEEPFIYVTYSEPFIVTNRKEPTPYRTAKNDEVAIRIRETS